jgi:hypothetical protein
MIAPASHHQICRICKQPITKGELVRKAKANFGYEHSRCGVSLDMRQRRKVHRLLEAGVYD